DLLATSVMLIDHDCTVRYANPAAGNLLESSARQLRGRSLSELFSGAERLSAAMSYAREHGASYTEHDLELGVGNHVALHVSCCATPVEDGTARALLLEFRPIDQRMKVDREERLLKQ